MRRWCRRRWSRWERQRGARPAAGVSASSTAFYLGAWSGYGIAEYPLERAVGMVEAAGGAVASIEPGEVAFYKMEGAPKGARYLLVRDAARRRAALTLVASGRAGRRG